MYVICPVGYRGFASLRSTEPLSWDDCAERERVKLYDSKPPKMNRDWSCGISCPVCSQKCRTGDAIGIIFLRDFSESPSNMAKSCFDCTEKNSAHSLCTNCNKWLCSTCAEQHRHGKAAGDHFLPVSHRGTSGTDGGSSNYLFCSLHNQETLKLFCETCDVLLCRHCLVLDHKDHRFRRLDEALQHQRVLLENVTTQVEEKKIVVQNAGKQIEDRLFEVKHIHRKVENQIKMTKMVIINELNKRTNSLLEQLEKITSENQHKFEQQLQSILVLNRQLEHVQNFINWAMYSKNSAPFLFSKELIVFQMQRLLETNCGADLGRPPKIRFTWEPSFWTKQISNLGCILTEGAHLPQTDVPGYGTEGVQSSYYPAHNPSTTAHPGPISNSQHYASTVQCPTPVCCTHCHTLPVPPVPKGQLTNSTASHNLSFTHPTAIKQAQVSSVPFNSSKEQKCISRPLRVIQPWLPHQPQTEHENSSYWLEHQQQRQQVQQTLPSAPAVCSVTPQDYNQIHNVHTVQHTAPISTQTSLQAPSVQMQLGPVHSLTHVPQQRHQQQSTLCQAESTHEQVMHHSLDIINQQFELEQMQKGLELLLQSQPSNVQLNQTKQPQHVQQTIVGQINYIVRQPAAIPLQSQEDVPQVCDEPISPGSHTVDLSPVTSHSPSNMQSQSIADEIIAAVEKDACRMNHFSANPVRKRSASESFSNSPDLELPSPRLSRSVDPQMESVSCEFFGQSQERPYSTGVETERLAEYGPVESAIPEDMQIGPSDHLATGASILGNAVCKVESEDFSCDSAAVHNDLPSESSHPISDLVLPLSDIFEEPINLSVRKCPPSTSTCDSARNVVQLPPTPVKPLKNEAEDNNGFQQHFTEDIKSKENVPRLEPKETKIPYVRLERLKICTPNSGELPVFKVQPQNKDEDGSVRLLVKYGAQSKSMSIKVNPDGPSPLPPSTDTSAPAMLPYGSESLPYPSEQATPRTQPQVKSLQSVNPYTGDTQKSRNRAETPAGPMCDPALGYNISAGPQAMRKSTPSEDPDEIENEDFCAVCLNGGEMLCCDHCPKVYHLACHVPALLSFPV
ncbi:tripartite motif-containing protein 66 [Rhinophrynus dorsalis]